MVNQDLFNKINTHILKDIKPAVYLNQISHTPVFKEYPFIMLYDQKRTKQSKLYHPEGNVWNHTMLVIDQAAEIKQKSKQPNVFMWASLLHDIGKPKTTQITRNKITSYNHETIGAEMARQFLIEFNCDLDFIIAVSNLIRWHMQILFVIKNSNYANIIQMIKETDIYEVALLGYCDRMGRAGANKELERQNITTFINKCKNRLNKDNLHQL